MDDPKAQYHGHKALSDGTHVPLSEQEAADLWREIEERQKRRAEKMPTEQDALDVMLDAFARLKELGWRDAIYCPKDGSHFEVIEAGSTGVFDASYEGTWPTGRWWVYDGDVWPSRPILFRPYAGRTQPTA